MNGPRLEQGRLRAGGRRGARGRPSPAAAHALLLVRGRLDGDDAALRLGARSHRPPAGCACLQRALPNSAT